MLLHRNFNLLHLPLLHLVAIGILLTLTACGGSSRSFNSSSPASGNFAGTPVTPSAGASVSSVTLTPATVVGGSSTQITVHLTQAAPTGGASVQLSNSDTSVVTTPSTIKVAGGATSGTGSASTKPVSAVTAVAISALYNNTVAGAALTIDPATTPSFTVSVAPSTLTIAPGNSGSTKITTKISTGYNHALNLTASGAPSGVSVTLTPATIAAPGAGTSKAEISVQSSVKPGSYAIKITAAGGTSTHSATLTLKVAASNPGPGAKFQGCWYQQSGNKYQGVIISVDNPGTYPFNAVLYHGTTCNPNDFADQFGFGTDLNFGGFDTIFWFTDFHDQTDTSAIWQVGSDTSACVNYTVAPNCQ